MPFIDNNGIKICYEIVDESDGKYLLLHTGLNSTKETWLELGYVEELKKYFKIILIDPRGHGASDKPLDLAKYTFEIMAADVIAVLDHLKIDKIHYLGYSLGSIIGWRVAKFYPEKIISMICGGSKMKHPPDYPNIFLRLSFMKEGSIVNPETPFEPDDISESLTKIAFPVLIFSGEEDQSTFPFINDLIDPIPNLKWFTIPGLNHPQAIIQKEKVLPQIIDFLTK